MDDKKEKKLIRFICVFFSIPVAAKRFIIINCTSFSQMIQNDRKMHPNDQVTNHSYLAVTKKVSISAYHCRAMSKHTFVCMMNDNRIDMHECIQFVCEYSACFTHTFFI